MSPERRRWFGTPAYRGDACQTRQQLWEASELLCLTHQSVETHSGRKDRYLERPLPQAGDERVDLLRVTQWPLAQRRDIDRLSTVATHQVGELLW
jgi:hypothetical protein